MRKMSYGALTSSFIIIPSLMLRLFVCQSVHLCLSLLSLGLCRSCPTLPEGTLRHLGVWAHFPSIASLGPESGTKQHLDDITDIGFRRSLHPSGEREGRGAGEGRQKRPKEVDKDLFVPEWWPILPGQRPGELLGVRHFSTAARCWDVEGWCGQRELLSYWDRGGLAWFAWCPEAFGGQ